MGRLRNQDFNHVEGGPCAARHVLNVEISLAEQAMGTESATNAPPQKTEGTCSTSLEFNLVEREPRAARHVLNVVFVCRLLASPCPRQAFSVILAPKNTKNNVLSAVPTTADF